LVIISFDLYVLLNFGEIREKIKQYSNIGIEVTSRIISDAIPKYKDPQQ
jgi:hypothetical protein